MDLKELREHYYELSGKTSDVVRALALSAIAIVWVFRVEVAGSPSVPAALILAGLLAVGSLACDLFQYVIATLTWGAYARKKEKEGVAETKQFDAPAWFNRPAITFFVLKIAMVAGCYTVLVVHLIAVIR